ncbi:MAG TPA: sensor domain-containing diguanylate cyclase [Thermoanaerobaculia bacterium]|nr:sensor domain-containing diguanylate cyclase [Thermoanaerobaculia bacterium]
MPIPLSSEESRRVLFETSALPMWIHDQVGGRFLAANDAMISSYGWSREELLNLPLDAVVASPSDRLTLSSVTPPLTLVDGGSHRRKDGRTLLVEVSVQEIDFEQRRGCLVLAIDVTERHLSEERIRHQALHDHLTGLANRVLFNDRLEQAVAHAHRHNSRLAAISIDLDDFKSVNDNFGHSFGDILISEVAGRLKSALRQTDTIARLGGDEFAVIVEGLVSASQAHEIALKVRELLDENFEVEMRSVRVTACIGISIYARDGHDAGMLFRNSESALNRAKEVGHDNIQLFDESMSD